MSTVHVHVMDVASGKCSGANLGHSLAIAIVHVDSLPVASVFVLGSLSIENHHLAQLLATKLIVSRLHRT